MSVDLAEYIRAHGAPTIGHPVYVVRSMNCALAKIKTASKTGQRIVVSFDNRPDYCQTFINGREEGRWGRDWLDFDVPGREADIKREAAHREAIDKIRLLRDKCRSTGVSYEFSKGRLHDLLQDVRTLLIEAEAAVEAIPEINEGRAAP